MSNRKPKAVREFKSFVVRALEIEERDCVAAENRGPEEFMNGWKAALRWAVRQIREEYKMVPPEQEQ